MGRVEQIATLHGKTAAVIGYTVDDPERRVWIAQRELVGKGDRFSATGERAPGRVGS